MKFSKFVALEKTVPLWYAVINTTANKDIMLCNCRARDKCLLLWSEGVGQNISRFHWWANWIHAGKESSFCACQDPWPAEVCGHEDATPSTDWGTIILKIHFNSTMQIFDEYECAAEEQKQQQSKEEVSPEPKTNKQ